MSENQFKLEFKNIKKTFLSGKILANDEISLGIKKGEIHSIIGENGSGKSTLMSILFGLYNQDSGNIYIDGKKVNMYQSGSSKKYKIGMVHQHFHLVDNFTVLENIILGQETQKISKKEISSLKQEIENINIEIRKKLENNSKLKEINDNYFSLKLERDKVSEKYFEKINDKKYLKNKFKLNSLNNDLNKSKNNLSKNKISKNIEILLEKVNEFENNEIFTLKKEEKELNKKIEKLKSPELNDLLKLEDSKERLVNKINFSNLTTFGFLNNKKTLKRFKFISKQYGINLDPNKFIRKLSIGDRQKVEILKTLWEEKEIIVFDEPTATLSVKEIENLLSLIKSLKKSGVTIIFISHKLNEVKSISDNISVLRKGKLMGTFENTDDLDIEEITKLMVGNVVKLDYVLPEVKDNVLLEVKNLSYYTSRGFKAATDVSFEVKEGEIFGIAGIEGNGQEEVLNSITGLKKPSIETKILYKEKDILNLPIIEKNKFISHVPIDRFKHGIISNMDLKFNSILTLFNSEKFSKILIKKINNKKNTIKTNNLIIDNSSVSEWTEKIINDFNVEGALDLSMEIKNLSGGNQQKFVISREINKPHEFIILGHPTRGLDIKSIDYIYQKIIKNSLNKATLIYSLEIHELMSVCHRIAIMYKGKIVDIINPRDYKIEDISKMMVGIK